MAPAHALQRPHLSFAATSIPRLSFTLMGLPCYGAPVPIRRRHMRLVTLLLRHAVASAVARPGRSCSHPPLRRRRLRLQGCARG
jgi:hypothetical protein